MSKVNSLCTLIVLFLCSCNSSDVSLDNDSSYTNEIIQSASPNVNCLDYLTHQNPTINRMYQEAFTMFGAFLIYLQDLVISKKNIEKELGQIKTNNLMTEIANGKYFNTPINQISIGDLVAIDKKITIPRIRTIWTKWCAHPDNFISWIRYPITHEDASNIEELAKDGGIYANRKNFLSWFDDGFWMMSRVIGIKIKGSPPQEISFRPDPEKWLIKIENGMAVTK